MLLWFLGYYLFIALDLAGNIRLALPMYLPLILWAAYGFGSWIKNESVGRIFIAGTTVLLFSLDVFLNVEPMRPEFTLRNSLRTEYLPLPESAKFLERLPDNTRVAGIDCTEGCFSFYLRQTRRLKWTEIFSGHIASIPMLRKQCVEKGIDIVMVASGSPAAQAWQDWDAGFAARFAASPEFIPVARFTFGENQILFARPRP